MTHTLGEHIQDSLPLAYQNPYEVLGLAPDTTWAQIEDTALKLGRDLAPQANKAWAGWFKDKLDNRYLMVKAAYFQLRDGPFDGLTSTTEGEETIYSGTQAQLNRLKNALASADTKPTRTVDSIVVNTALLNAKKEAILKAYRSAWSAAWQAVSKFSTDANADCYVHIVEPAEGGQKLAAFYTAKAEDRQTLKTALHACGIETAEDVDANKEPFLRVKTASMPTILPMLPMELKRQIDLVPQRTVDVGTAEAEDTWVKTTSGRGGQMSGRV